MNHSFDKYLSQHWIDIVDRYVDRCLIGTRDAAPQTITGYLYDLRAYLEFYRAEVSTDLDELEFDKTTLRDFVIYLRKKLSALTIERRINGMFSFWNFLHIDLSYPEPVTLSSTGVRLKKRPVKTEPLNEGNYKKLLRSAINELRSFAEN
jgi:site-specific recombinase XerD